jgi:hypothetical protein
MDYWITRSRNDYNPHIYEWPKAPYFARFEMIYDEIWDGLIISVDLSCADVPREVGGEFELLGRRFVIIDIDHMRYMAKCAVANTEGYRLLLHQIIFDAELRLTMFDIFRGMPRYMQAECWDEYMNQRNTA